MYGIYMIGAAVDAVALTPKLTEVTEPTIRLLVDAFYARVRRDPTLAPVFAAAIAADAWPVHLEKMYAFWSSVMLTSGRYKGDPVATHRKLADVAPPMFGEWLDLFEATATELFIPDLAAAFITKARRIAESLKLALFFRPDRSWPDDLRRRPEPMA
jgi:hemoglobin